MASSKASINDSLSLSEAKWAKKLLFPPVGGGEDFPGRHKEMDFLDNEMGFLDVSPFTIRNFVSTVRGKDFSKCWPFRHRILERCLSNGMIPQLPPFDSPPKTLVCLPKETWQEPAFTNGKCEHITSESTECMAQGLLEKNNVRFSDSKSLVEALGKCVSAIQAMDCDADAQLEAKQSEEGWSEVINTIGLVAVVGGTSDADCPGKENKPDEGVEPGAGIKMNSDLLHSCKVNSIKDVDQRRSGMDVANDLKTLYSEIECVSAAANDPDQSLSSNVTIAEPGFIGVVRPGSSVQCDGAAQVEGEPSNKCRLFCEDCCSQAEVENLAPVHFLEHAVGVSTFMKTCQVENKTPDCVGTLGSDFATTSSVDQQPLGQHNRVETCKNCEESGAAGINSDPLIPQVCPVCLNFTSTSNTALNAHIDHCLETILPSERSQVRLHKNRIKARKMRSMAEICAVAPARTLEDLELSSQLWALNEEMSPEDTSCSLGWRDGVIRRQPRTPLNRGSAGIWKTCSKLEGESKQQHITPALDQNHNPVENAQKKYLVTKPASRHSEGGILNPPNMNISNNVHFEDSQPFHRERPCPPAPLKFTHAAYSMRTGKLRNTTEHNKVQRLEGSLRSAEGSKFADNVSVDLCVSRSLGGSLDSHIMNTVACSNPIKSGSGECRHHGLMGASPSQSRSERVVEHHCHKKKTLVGKVCNHSDNAALSAASKKKKNQDLLLIQSCDPLQHSDRNKVLIVAKKWKKRRKVFSNRVSIQYNPKSAAGASLLDEELAHQNQSGTLNCHDITLVDTSAEEANMLSGLICCIDFPQDQECKAATAQQQGSMEAFPNEYGDIDGRNSKLTDISNSISATVGNQYIKRPSGVSKFVCDAPKKRSFTEMQAEWTMKGIANTSVDNLVTTKIQLERPTKKKKIAAETKSMVTIGMALEGKDCDPVLYCACKDLCGNKGACMDGLQKITSDQESCLNMSFINGAHNFQGKILKRTHLATMKVNPQNEVFDKHLNARLDPSNQPSSPYNLDFDQATEQAKTPTCSSVVLNTPHAEHGQQCGVQSDSADPASPAKEMPSPIFARESQSKGTTEELALPTNRRLITSSISSKYLNQEEIATTAVKEMKNLDNNTKILDNGDHTHQSEVNDANLAQSRSVDCIGAFEDSKKAVSIPQRESQFRSFTGTLQERVASLLLHQQTLSFDLASSVDCLSALSKPLSQTSSNCIQTSSMCTFASITDICSSSIDGLIPFSSVNMEANVSMLPSFQTVVNVRSTTGSSTGVDAPDSATAPITVSEHTFSAAHSSTWLGESEVSIAAGMTNSNFHVNASSTKVDVPDISKELSWKHGLPQVSLEAGSLCDRTVVMNNDNVRKLQGVITSEGGSNLFMASKCAQNAAKGDTSEGLEKVTPLAHGRVNWIDLTVVAQDICNTMARAIPHSTGPKLSNPGLLGDPLHHNYTLACEVGALNHSIKPTINSQKVPVQSDLLVDVATTMADNTRDTVGARSATHQRFAMENPILINNQQRTFKTSLQCTLTEFQKFHEQMTPIHLQEIAGRYSTDMGIGYIQPQILKSTMQIKSGSSSKISADHATSMPGSLHGFQQSGKLPSNQPMCDQFPSARMSVSLEANLASRLNGYGSVDYAGEQGIVHIFGNPVFKLMGKNVMVTSKDAQSLCIEHPTVENARESLHNASSAQHLECMGSAGDCGFLQAVQSKFLQHHLEAPVYRNPDMFSSPYGSWSRPSRKPKNYSVRKESVDIHSCAMQNFPFPTFGGIEHSGYRGPTVRKPPISMTASGERLRTFGSAVGMQLKRHKFVNCKNKSPAQVIVIDDSLPSSGSSIPAVICRGDQSVTQLNVWPSSSFSVSMDETPPHTQASELPSKQNQCMEADFFSDLHKLGLGAPSNLLCGNHQSGTLSDIVQSSDRNKDRCIS